MTCSSESCSFVCILGAPGSGKGTICHKLSQDYGFYHLSVGDYMRELSRDTTSNHQEIMQDYLRQGRLLPTELILPILENKIENEKKKGAHRFLIDGFPRQLAQGVEFEKQIGTPALVIVFQCPQDTARQRYLCRKLSDRLLDNEEMFEKRFKEFDRENPDIVHYYRSIGTLEMIDSSSETEVTYARLLATIRRKYGWEKGANR